MKRNGMWWPYGLVVVAGLVLAGCMGGEHIVLAPSSVVPAASMQIQLGTDSNGNTIVQLKAEHLAQPASLTPPAANYTVWIETRGQAPERAALLKPDSGLKAQVQFVTPERNFTLLVTAEQQRNPLTPSATVIVRSPVARPS